MITSKPVVISLTTCMHVDSEPLSKLRTMLVFITERFFEFETGKCLAVDSGVQCFR